MRAISQDHLGGADVLHVATIPRPAPGPSEVLVRVVSTCLNPTDWVHRRVPGFLGDGSRVLGWDVAGVIEEVGLGVTLHDVGDPVFGMLPYPYGHGAAAEYVIAPARALTAAPEGVDLSLLGAVPLAGLTAWQALIDTAGLEAGQRVLVHGAAGGVGHLAVQIAKARGAYVIGTATGPKHELLRSLGADEMIDYQTTNVSDAVADVDVVLDSVGGDTAARSLPTLTHGGVIVSLALNTTTPIGETARAAGASHRLMLVEHDHHGMNELALLIAEERLKPVIATTVELFDIEEVRRAHQLGETGHVTGKIVLQA
ncbi:MAG: NADP-dependent oxidoreductase [Nocardioides sp.]|uniref:NADP-dependent oxidoreductase n=1 Tax=Nocardioides sp. TaxID=35761 RepID=UPI0039E51551